MSAERGEFETNVSFTNMYMEMYFCCWYRANFPTLHIDSGARGGRHRLQKHISLLVLSLLNCVWSLQPYGLYPLGSSLYPILLARTLERVVVPSSTGDLPNPGIEPPSLTSPAFAGRFFTSRITWDKKIVIIKLDDVLGMATHSSTLAWEIHGGA